MLDKVTTMVRHWLPLALVITAMCGLVYLVAQQTLRIGANDPQIQIAEDAANALARGASAQAVLPTNPVDVASSLAPFVVILNASKEPMATSGLLHGQTPTLPAGVLDAAKAQIENRVTWQPEPGVRIALVVVSYAGANPGFVVAGRSLREIEKRIDLLGLIVGAAWLATMSASGIVVAFAEFALAKH